MASLTPYNWTEMLARAKRLILAGRVSNWSSLARELGIARSSIRINFTDLGIDEFEQIATFGENRLEFDGVKAPDVIQALQGGPLALDALCDKIDRGPTATTKILEAMIAAGYGIERTEQEIAMPIVPAPVPGPTLAECGSRWIKIAVCSDTHIGSKYTQLTNLRAFVDEAVNKYGCQHVFCAGDITAGNGVYRGQVNEVYARGADEQIECVLNDLPYHDDVTWYLLGGNHDYSHYKLGGINVVKYIAEQRDDLEYVGFGAQDIRLTDKVDLRMWHPSGGVPYAISYRAQKYAIEVSKEELVDVVMGEKRSPRIRAIIWGHLHISGLFWHGPIALLGPGCFEAQTPYLREKGLFPEVSGVILEIELTDDGLIHTLTQHWKRYAEMDDDYLCQHNPQHPETRTLVTPIFSLESDDERGL